MPGLIQENSSKPLCKENMNHRCAFVFFLLIIATAHADEVHVAVASNFTAPMQQLSVLFERDTGHKVFLSFGASGMLYAQIVNGAPFEVLLSADKETPMRLINEGVGVVDSAFTYAVGRLVLWSSDPKLIDNKGNILRRNGFRHLAIANPKTAPYGTAAMQTMTRLGVADALKPHLVQGENISQTHQFVSTGAAELGFVAYSQVVRNGQVSSGSGWIVPSNLHEPIHQYALMLARGKDKPAALAFLTYLKSKKSQAIIKSFGYELR